MDHAFESVQKRSHPTWCPRLEPLDPSADGVVALPLLGLVSAGQPVVAVEARETVQVPARLVRRQAMKRSFALYVRGDSMIDDAIEDGDLVVVEQRPTAENGETVVARLDGYQVTLKRFYHDEDGVRLQPANTTMEPMLLTDGEVEILGVVSGVIRTA
ncbi:repressor LexA [Thiocapsa imhoffii]|uniref:Repressor LexA n=1 Tax=Thiocapsa imhoffii TaxID=382777 RepID=A0A9X1B9U0_9GAMM|nr:transcriptional repressor LexA [Thiocapsa imhoffii]MBK1646217.1 repressor LexA [Thiocapsa imhoffii]